MRQKRPASASKLIGSPAAKVCKADKVASKCRAPHSSSSPLDSVVKVFAAFSEPNYAVPWAYKTQDARSGTAFPIAFKSNTRRWLLTNAHVVRYAAVVQVRKRGDHQKFIAQVLCVGLDCDLALLTVDDPSFWRGLRTVEFNWDLPQLQDEVTVAGFPIGGDNTCVTVGVVSRIDMQAYNTWWSKALLAIQIDAAINPGNSGGPCFASSGHGSSACIGVAFQGSGYDESENIGYIIPAEVVKHFLDDYSRNGRYTGFGNCGFSEQTLENSHMREALGLRKGQTGMLIRSVEPSSPANRVLQQGDIVLTVEGHAVGDDGKVAFRGTNNERIDFKYLMSKRFVGESCKLKIIRQNVIKDVRLKLACLQPLVMHDPPAPPPYFVVGGLVFVPLSEPFLKQHFGSDYTKESPVAMKWHWLEGMRKFEGQEVIVLSQVLASPLTVGFTDFYDVILRRFNGAEPKNLKHLIEMVSACKTTYFTFELERHSRIVLPRQLALARMPAILKENMIPRDRSIQYLTRRK